METSGIDFKDVNEKIKVIKSNKCNQCDYAASQTGQLKKHLKTHSGEKPNKCNQCDYASSQARNLGTHMKMQEKNHIQKFLL